MGKGTRAPALLLEDSWRALRAIEVAHTVGTQLAMLPSSRRGVWRVRARVFTVVDGRPHMQLVDEAVEWPNSMAMSFEACVFQLVNSVANRTEEAVEALRDQAQF